MNVQEFKDLHKRFTEALNYIVKNNSKLKADSEKWKKVQLNFINKFEKPLDEAWNQLPEDLKKKFASVYLHRKAMQDKTIQTVVKVFDAKIVKVIPEVKDEKKTKKGKKRAAEKNKMHKKD